MKKIMTAIICLIILTSSMGLVTSATAEEKQDETFTIYRVDSNGEISPVEVEIDLDNIKNNDIGQTLEDICTKLFKNDLEMQKYCASAQENNSNQSSKLSFAFGMVRVKSHGRGFHFKTKTRVRILTKFKFFKIMLPRIRITARKPIVFCKYDADQKAETTYNSLIKSYMNKNSTSTTITGNHSVFVRNFIGYTTWTGRFSSPFTKIIPRAFSGIGKYVVCNQFN